MNNDHEKLLILIISIPQISYKYLISIINRKMPMQLTFQNVKNLHMSKLCVAIIGIFQGLKYLRNTPLWVIIHATSRQEDKSTDGRGGFL